MQCSYIQWKVLLTSSIRDIKVHDSPKNDSQTQIVCKHKGCFILEKSRMLASPITKIKRHLSCETPDWPASRRHNRIDHSWGGLLPGTPQGPGPASSCLPLLSSFPFPFPSVPPIPFFGKKLFHFPSYTASRGDLKSRAGGVRATSEGKGLLYPPLLVATVTGGCPRTRSLALHCRTLLR